MTATYDDSTGNGSNKNFNYTFPILQTEDVKVALNRVVQATTKYTVNTSANPTRIEFNNTSLDSTLQTTTGANAGAPLNGVTVRVFRETTVGKASGDDDPKALFAAGSSIRAVDLNANTEQALYAIHELQDQPVDTPELADGSVTSAKILDGTIQTVDIANSAINSDKIATNAVTSNEILNGAVTTNKLATGAVGSSELANNSVNSHHYIDGSIEHEHLTNDCVDGDNIADDTINSNHYVAGSIDHEHLANDIIDGDNIQDDVVNSEHIAAGALDNEHYAAGSITSDKLNGATVVTNSEHATSTPNDTSFFTTAATDARFFRQDSSETITSGASWSNSDSYIATTAAIDARVIDLVDNVGGFVPVPNETSFPAANPDINNPPAGGTIVSIKAASEALPNGVTATLSGTTLTIANGRGTNSQVIITGAPSTIPSGFGFLVETTSTDHTYAFHRLVPKATEVTTVATNATQVQTVHTNITNINAVANNATNINAVAADATDIGAVAGKATEIGRLGTADAVADMAILGTADVVADLNTLGTADVVADMNMLATSDVVADMNMLATADVVSDMNALATTNNITAMDTCRDNIASINNCSSNISSVNTFGDQYQVKNNDPQYDGGGNQLNPGDLYFNTSANELKVYNGSSWQAGVTATGNFATVTGNTFTGDNRYNDGVKLKLGTGSDLELMHNASSGWSRILNTNGDLYINNIGTNADDLYIQAQDDINIRPQAGEDGIKVIGNGAVVLHHDGSPKLTTTSTGILLEDSSAKTTAPLQIRNLNSSGVCTNPKLEFYGRTVVGQGSIPYIQSVHGTEAGGSNAANDGGLEFHTRNGGTGTDTMCMHMSHDARVGIRTITPSHALDVVGDIQIQSTHARLFLTDTNQNPDWSLENENGIFRIKDQTAGQSRLTINSGGEVSISNKVFLNGGLDIDNDVQFNTGTTNSNILFDASAGALEFTDGNKAVFGTGNDLEIYHSSGVSYITDSGPVVIQGDYLSLQRPNGNKYVQCTASNKTQIFFDGQPKFETSSTGATVTGDLLATGLFKNDTAGEGLHNTATNAKFYSNNSNDTRLEHASNAQVKLSFIGTGSNYRGAVSADANGMHLLTGASGEQVAVKCVTDGTTELRHSGNRRLATQSNGFEALGGLYTFYGPEGGESQIHMYADEGDDVNDRWRLMAGTDNSWILGNLSDGSWDTSIKASGGGAITLYHDDSPKFATTTNGIDVTGRVVCDRADIDGQVHVQYGSGTNTNYMATLQNNNGIMHIFRGDALYIGNNMNTSNQGSGPNNKAISLKTNGDIIATGNCTANAFYGDGSNLTGVSSVGGSTGVDFNDNVAARFGTSNDATVKHDGYSSLQISYSSADTSVSSQTPAGIRILNTSNTDGGLNGIYFSSGGQQANVGIFARQKDNATSSAGEGCDMWFYTKRNGQSIMGQRARFTNYGHFIPAANDTYDLGDSSIRWRNIYTNDLHLSNEGGSNDVDGSWGDWTIQEGESDLFLKNNRSGKKYKFNLTEIM